jgi:hypothetical protein
MAPREYTHSPQCVYEGCTERANYYFDRRDEQRREIERLRKQGGWRCVRHTRPDEVLSLDAPAREVVLETYETDFDRPEQGTHRFFRRGDGGGSGFMYGPGFKAYAKDFPAGTRLIVSARIEAPASSASQASEDDGA